MFAIIVFFYRMVRNKETWQMANQIKMANIQAILTLHQNNGWSNRRIARELGINRGTV